MPGQTVWLMPLMPGSAMNPPRTLMTAAKLMTPETKLATAMPGAIKNSTPEATKSSMAATARLIQARMPAMEISTS